MGMHREADMIDQQIKMRTGTQPGQPAPGKNRTQCSNISYVDAAAAAVLVNFQVYQKINFLCYIKFLLLLLYYYWGTFRKQFFSLLFHFLCSHKKNTKYDHFLLYNTHVMIFLFVVLCLNILKKQIKKNN